MALLDRFRAQPRQKHPDPAVRLAFVQEIPMDERELLAEIAREDPDARVKRAAVEKLMDPAALGALARSEADEGVRSSAVAMLRDIALEAFEGVTESDSLAAVDALTDAKVLAGVAKSSARESIALRAMARTTDVHALGSIARHAELEPIRRMAFETLEDKGEILAVALNSDYKDTAVAAVDRLSERDDLERIAAHGRNKGAVKRARGLLREMDARVAAEAAEAAERPAPVAPPDPEAVARQEAALREEEGRLAAARAEGAARAQADAEAARARAALEEAEAVERRRLEEEKLAAQRAEEAERRRARLAELLPEAEAAAADEDLASALRRFGIVARELAQERKMLAAALGVPVEEAVDPDLAARYQAADSRVAVRSAEARDEDARRRRDMLARFHQLLTRVEPLAAKADLTLKAAERAAKDIRSALADQSPLPSKRDHEDVVHRLKAAQAALAPKLQELRDFADWQRWANIGIQEQLCEKMEALRAVEDPGQIMRQVRDLQEQWRLAADVPREKGEALWRRFKTAHDEAWARCESHVAQEKAARAENLAKKVAMCERAEALADSTNWIQTAEEIKRLQAEWKAIGAVVRGQEKALWERFRVACDRFFTRRHADLAERKKVWAENLAKKDALCVQAEALSGSTDWDAAAAQVRTLQAEWKAVGPVKKSRSEQIWQRFRAACDAFFVRYAQRHDIALGERVAAREAICAELEALAGQVPSGTPPTTESAESAAPSPETPGEPPADLAVKVRGLRVRWQQEIAARGVDRDKALALDARFQAAFNGVLVRWPAVFAGTELDADSNRKRMEALVLRMEELAKSVAGPAGNAAADAALSPTTRLAAMLKEALASNTIGGKVDDGSRLRAAAEEVRQAQASWSRIGPVAEHLRRALADRFQRACRRIADEAGKTAQGSGLRAQAGSRPKA